MGELWGGIQPLLTDTWFYLRVLGGVVLWYLLAWAIANIAFGSGRGPVEAAVLGAWAGVAIATALAVLLALYVWSSAPLAVALGLLVFVVPLVLTLALTRSAQAG